MTYIPLIIVTILNYPHYYYQSIEDVIRTRGTSTHPSPFPFSGTTFPPKEKVFPLLYVCSMCPNMQMRLKRNPGGPSSVRNSRPRPCMNENWKKNKYNSPFV